MELGSLKCIWIFLLAWSWGHFISREVWCCCHLFSPLKMRIMGTFIAYHKVSNQEDGVFTLADLWWSSVVIYPAECNLFGRQIAPLVPEEAAVKEAISLCHLSTFISMISNGVADLRPQLWLQVCANVRVQLDPIWILHKPHGCLETSGGQQI